MRRLLVFSGLGVAIFREEVIHRVFKHRRAVVRVGGRHEAQRDAGDRGMHARFMHRHPGERAEEQVDADVSHSRPAHSVDERKQPAGDQQRLDREVGCIKDGDDGDRADVVRNRQREQEHAQLRGDPSPDERQDSQREGDVRGHRDTPSALAFAAGVQRDVDQRGDDHAAQGSGNRQHRLLEPGQFASCHLPLDLKPDDEEEERHQAIVYPAVQVIFDVEDAGIDGELSGEEVEVGLVPRRVRPDQRHDGGKEQRDATDDLCVDEPLGGQHELPEDV